MWYLGPQPDVVDSEGPLLHVGAHAVMDEVVRIVAKVHLDFISRGEEGCTLFVCQLGEWVLGFFWRARCQARDPHHLDGMLEERERNPHSLERGSVVGDFR